MITKIFVQLRSAHAGALKVLIICFIASGVLRLGVLGPALALQLTNVDDTVGDPTQTIAANCPAPPNPDALLLAIREREQQLDQRERTIEERLTVLSVATEEFERQQASLVEAEKKLAATLAIADSAAENDIRQITAVYENMKPKDAAEVFDTMDQKFAAGFLIRMNPQAAANILAAMEADNAYGVSLLMANRNIEAPRN